MNAEATPSPAYSPHWLPPGTPWFYRLVWTFGRMFLESIGQADAAGMENIPRTGPFLLVSNHVSYLDPLIVGCYLPRTARFFARKSLWKPGPLSWIFDGLRCIPLDRDGDSDIAGFKRVIAALKAGEAVQMFPEGTRSPDGKLQPGKRGPGLLAARLGVSVIPARIFGGYETLKRGTALPRIGNHIGITYGKLMTPKEFDPGPGDPDRYDVAVKRIMDAIAALQPPWAETEGSSNK